MDNKEYIESIMEKYNIKYNRKYFGEDYNFRTKYFTTIVFDIWEYNGFFGIKVEGATSIGTRFFKFEMLSAAKDKDYILECLEKHIPTLKKGVLTSDRVARKAQREKEKREKIEQERLQNLAKQGLIKFERYGTYTIIDEEDDYDE